MKKYTLEVCENCVHVADSGAPTYEGYAESGHPSAYAKGLELWGGEPFFFGGDGGSFSWQSCDFCGDPLGGGRYTATVVTRKVGA
jgi:hypothetical protein